MKNRLILIVLLLCLAVLTACGSVSGEGVLIVPSEVVASASETETESAEEPGAAEAAVHVTEAVTADESPVTGEAVSEKVRQLLEDAAFLALLEQYGVDVQSDGQTVLGAASAVLDYLDIHPEYGDGVTAEAVLPDGNTVWWTQGGSVWHVTPDCSALAKSKSLRHGSEAEAAAVGKSRVCKRCGS